ncbi:Delta-like protein [Caenorhabditis elegans]|uniref:Delta-like protein n=2 Tax=Caenorhabditis elegans TaxID=6239 RepID=Q95Y10_CAEEL|nr:Delta-like protein [Caenorhabditis elegans]CCD66710.1 Delta-like protein [Caenorhabditis elegans]|eukprot:NP_500108.1 Delta-like protein [Caenorhabditis elegans]
MIKVIFALFLAFQQITCSGYLELYFQSEFHLKATVNITSCSTTAPPTLIPLMISSNETVKMHKVPMKMDGSEYQITIFVINQDRLDIDNATITTSFVPKNGQISPLTVMFPFTGIRMRVGCDEQWHGEKCDVFCCSETASRVGKVCNSHGQLGCPQGKRGLDCALPISKKWCKCQNNGACISSFGKNLHEKMQCECQLGFRGSHCEERVDNIEMKSTYGVDPKKFEIATAKMLYESVVDNELVEVKRERTGGHFLQNLRINDQ